MRFSVLALCVILNACASPNPSRVNVSMMGTKAYGDNTTIVARSGDTVYKLSEYLQVDLRAFIDRNNLQPPYDLTPGQVLRVPPPSTVRANDGDTVFSIARAYNADQSEIVRLNNLSPPYRFYLGQVVRIPAGNTNTAITVVEESAPVIDNPTVIAENVPVASRTPPRPVAVSKPLAIPPKPVAPVVAPPPSPFATASKPVPGLGMPYFSWPVNGSTLSAYGPKQGGRHNDGINIGAPSGTPVRTAAAGEVVYTGDNVAGFGNLILVRHSGGFATAYAHVQKPLVHQGQQLAAGQTIAQIGKTGNVSSPQLHFEIRKGTQPVDPKPYLP